MPFWTKAEESTRLTYTGLVKKKLSISLFQILFHDVSVHAFMHTVSLISFGESVIWHKPVELFQVAETGGGII